MGASSAIIGNLDYEKQNERLLFLTVELNSLQGANCGSESDLRKDRNNKLEGTGRYSSTAISAFKIVTDKCFLRLLQLSSIVLQHSIKFIYFKTIPT